MAEIKGADMVRDNLVECLRGMAMGLGFRSWRYAVIKGAISIEGMDDIGNEVNDEFYADSGCTMSLIDRSHLVTKAPNYETKIKSMVNPVKVRGIGEATLASNEYISLGFHIPGSLEGKPVTARLVRDIHIVDNLQAKVLLGMDFLGPERMTLDFEKRKLSIGSCQGMVTELDVQSRGSPISRVVRAQSLVTIPAYSVASIPIKMRGKASLPSGRDFMFLPHDRATYDLGPEGGVFSRITDANLSVVQARNATGKAVMIPRNAKLGVVQDYEEEGCFVGLSEDAHLAAGAISHGLTKTSAACVASKPLADPVQTSSKSPIAHNTLKPPATIPTTRDQPGPSCEHVTPNGITVYGEPSVRDELIAVAESFPNLWQDTGSTVNIPPDEWMPINIKEGAKVEASKVYPLGPSDREFVDNEFNKLHSQGRMQFSTEPTPHGYPVFVVWRTLHKPGEEPIRKGRVVVDIRGLNKISESDSYPMPLQTDITSAVSGCQYIIVFDAASFFHQWLVRQEDRHKLTVVSHRGQEQFNVAVMGFKNSPPYVQRKIDGILRDFRRPVSLTH